VLLREQLKRGVLPFPAAALLVDNHFIIPKKVICGRIEPLKPLGFLLGDIMPAAGVPGGKRTQGSAKQRSL
jgi:hypothetical protein